jgi:hypothetical protein
MRIQFALRTNLTVNDATEDINRVMQWTDFV